MLGMLGRLYFFEKPQTPAADNVATQRSEFLANAHRNYYWVHRIHFDILGVPGPGFELPSSHSFSS
jgi:hypothetical protein